MKKTLNETRISKKITQTAIAKRLGIPLSTYYVYEKGKRSIPQNVAVKIANILGVSVGDIFLPATFTVSKTTSKTKSSA